MADFAYSDLLPLGPDETTEYRLTSTEGVSTFEVDGRTFLRVEPGALTLLAAEAMHDIAHYLRASHLQQLRDILDDPEASANDRFVATELLLNANIAAGGVLPMCQDTGTAIVMGKKGEQVVTFADDSEALSKGIFDTYTTSALRYSQLAPIDMFAEKNTGNNLPAQVEIYSVPGDRYELLFMAKGGGSANKSFLFQKTKALLNEESLVDFLDESLRQIGTSACPPYHLALVVGGTSAEFNLKTAKYASAHYLDTLPTSGDEVTGHGYRDLEWERRVLELTREFGIGAQFGGKYFCPRRTGHSAAEARRIQSSRDGRQLLRRPSGQGQDHRRRPVHRGSSRPIRPGSCPRTAAEDLGSEVVAVDLDRPMDEVRNQLSQYPVKTRLSLTGTLVVGPGHRPMPASRSASTPANRCPTTCEITRSTTRGRPRRPRATRRGRSGPTTAGRMDSYVDQFQAAGGSMVMLAKGNPLAGGHRGLRDPRRLLPRLDRRAGRPAGSRLHPQGRAPGVPRAGHGSGLAHRGRGLPRLHRDRRQGQRLLRRGHDTGEVADLMKVRIGYGIPAAPRLYADVGGLGRLVDRIEELGYDSLWFPERINSPQLDPIVAMAYVAGRVERLKFGPAVSVLPGRNPVVMAKALASLDVVSNGRCLPAVGLGIANAAEHQAFQVDRTDRAPWVDEALPLMRRLWSGEEVFHQGDRFHIDGARVLPTPVQDPFEVWLGGRAGSELRRCGRLGDGWLASFMTPPDVATGIETIKEVAAEAGREIDPGHYGVLIPYAINRPIPARTMQMLEARRPGVDPTEVVATSLARLGEMVEAFVAVGATKFVLFPGTEPDDWEAEVDSTAVTLSLQT